MPGALTSQSHHDVFSSASPRWETKILKQLEKMIPQYKSNIFYSYQGFPDSSVGK